MDDPRNGKVAMPPFLPYGRQLIEDDDIAAVAEVLRSDVLTTGPAVAAFEGDLAAAVGAAHAVACANGTAALHLTALALGLGPGDRVVVPAVTFVATANAARFVGAEVVFADVDPATGLMTPATLAEAMARAGGPVKAAYPVHLNGQTVDIAALAQACPGLALVEDACHALGSRTGAGPTGNGAHSAMTVFSFHPVKTVCMGEGGAVTTNDPTLAALVAKLRGHGISREAGAFRHPDEAFAASGEANPWYYEMQELGFNYRVPDVLCALGRSQLAKLPRFAAARRSLAARYDRLLEPLAPRVRPIAKVPGCEPVLHLYVVKIDFAAAGLSRAEVMTGLRARGIGSQVHYLPVNRQPYYVERYGQQSLPGADAYYAGCLSLPLFPGMAEDDPDRVVEALSEILGP
jgi:UDP-4-amino-4,6-dideoxy-N-acetyl-beta-L-altrosamine transaminase